MVFTVSISSDSVNESKAATSGFPRVKVPVLSKAREVIPPLFSNAFPSRIRIPRAAAALVPAMIAAGVASPIAHGHATINTATPWSTAAANRDSLTCAGQRNGWNNSVIFNMPSGQKNQPKRVPKASMTTIGTNTELT